MRNKGQNARPDQITVGNLLRMPVYVARGLKYHAAGCLYTPKPLQVIFCVTRRCDSRCVMCSDWRVQGGVKELTLSEMEKVLGDALFDSVKKLSLSGGEPTLREDMVEIADIVLRSLPRLQEILLLTNGLNPDLVTAQVRGLQSLPNWEDLDRFSVSVSLDGLEGTHELIRRVPQAFERVDETIRRLQELSRASPFYISLVCVVQPLNLTNMIQVSDYAREHGLPLTFVPVCLSDGFVPDAAGKKALSFDDEQLRYLRALFENELKSRLNPSNLPCWREYFRIVGGGMRTVPCQLLRHVVGLDADGTLYLCDTDDSLTYGSALESSPSALWYSREAEEVRRRAERNTCPKCSMCCDTAFAFAHEFFYYAGFLPKEKGRKLVGR